MEKGIADVRGQQWAEYTCVTHFTEPRHGKYLPYSQLLFSIRLIQGEIITKLQHLLIGSYFNTYANPSINDIKRHKSDIFFRIARQGRGFPMCTKKQEPWG